MKFVLKQEKLQDLFEKLLVKDMFPSSIITTKEGKLFSIQKEEHGRALRFLNVKGSFFESIDDSAQSIELDIERALNMIKNILPNTVLTVETKGNKLSISGKNVDAYLSFKEPDGEVMNSLSDAKFNFKDGVPHIGNEQVPLNDFFEIKLPEFKDLANFASSLKTEFYKFNIDGGKIAVRVGDLHDFSDYVILNPDGKINKGKDLNVIFTYGIPQIANTFHEVINIRSSTDCPGWFYENTDDYTLGVLIPPYVESGE